MTAVVDRIVARLAFDARGGTALGSDLDWSARIVVASPADETGSGELARFLYAHYYACSPLLYRAAWTQLPGLARHASEPVLVRALSAANPGAGYWDPGWTVERTSGDGTVLARKDGPSLYVAPALRAGPAAVGATIGVRFPKESTGALPGFYLAYSDLGPRRQTGSTRIYLNLRPHRAAGFIHSLLGAFRAGNLRYTLKAVANSGWYERRDNTVVYVARSDFEPAALIVAATAAAEGDALKPGVPGMTLQLHPGVGVADSPPSPDDGGPPMSFGQHRMDCLARLLPAAVERGVGDRVAIRQALVDGLAAFGVDPDRPHLASPNSPDYRLAAELRL